MLGSGVVILVAVGTQFPFDRLIETVDSWATSSGTTGVVAQAGPSSYVASSVETHAFLPPREFEALLERAELVVAHCGMGSILSALSHGKPIVVMPRSADKGEHRNDHQFATAQRFSDHPGVTVAWDEADLRRCLDDFSNRAQGDRQAHSISSKAPSQFTDRLREFLNEGTR
jgi:UDP-N-acetylglucosamine transferase subunit ALG13